MNQLQSELLILQDTQKLQCLCKEMQYYDIRI